MRLRVGTAADTATVARIFTACWQDAYLGVVAAEVLARLDIPAAAALWTPLLAAADPDGEVIVAEDGGGAVNGLIRFGLDPEERSRGHVFSLYVDPIVAAAGIGGALLGQAVSWFCSRRMGEATLWVFEANRHARGFYERRGWAPDGARRVEPEFGADEVRLRRAFDEWI